MGCSFGLLLLVGCQAIPVHRQAVLSQPNLQFSESSAFAYGTRTTANLEPGTEARGGAAASGCSACQ
jgi:hypothetical protein